MLKSPGKFGLCKTQCQIYKLKNLVLEVHKLKKKIILHELKWTVKIHVFPMSNEFMLFWDCMLVINTGCCFKKILLFSKLQLEISHLKQSKRRELERQNLARDCCSETDTDGDVSDIRDNASHSPQTSKSSSAQSKLLAGKV